jgi:hypothetical protein
MSKLWVFGNFLSLQLQKMFSASRMFVRSNMIAPYRAFRTSSNLFFKIGDPMPNFTAETTEGEIDFHQWIGQDWALLVSVNYFVE